MAIANYEALSELLNEGDYNVRITVGHAENQQYTAFLELIRDSLGGGILNSDEFMSFEIIGVRKSGTILGGIIAARGNELMTSFEETPEFEELIAIRLDKSTKTGKNKTWIIVR